MLLTPTYYVFDMFQVHQDAKYLPIKLKSPDYEVDGKKIEAVNISASRDAYGKIHISLVNLDLHNTVTVSAELKDLVWKNVTGTILSSANITDINTFDEPYKLQIHEFTGAKKSNDKLVVAIPAKSVIMLELN